MRKLICVVTILATGCIQQYGLRQIGQADAQGNTLHEGQVCTDTLCAKGAAALAIYQSDGTIIPVGAVGFTSPIYDAAGTAALIGGLAAAGTLDGLAHNWNVKK